MINSTNTGMPYKWDNNGLTHKVEGDEVLPGITLLWTICGIDVPANSAYASWQCPINCPKCLGSSA